MQMGSAHGTGDEGGATSDLQGAFLKIGQSFTRRRELAEALRASEARYRTLLENILDYAIFLLDRHGTVTEWTPGARKVTGYDADEVIGRHLNMFFPADAVTAGEPAAEMAEAAATGRAERVGWRVRTGGEHYWANEIVTAVRDAAGDVTGFTKITRDLTDAVIAETAAERARAEAEREALRQQLAAAEERERQRLARELHDQLGQHLTAFALGCADARRRLASGELSDETLARLEELSGEMTRDARYIALELRPPELDDVGLESALATYVEEWQRRYGVTVEMDIAGEAARAAVPVDVGTAVYRVVQEALTNVARHAEATHVTVILDMPSGALRLVVEDDGRGFDPDGEAARIRAERRLGLASMRERAALAGGTLQVESRPGGGTAVYLRVPVEG